MPNTFKSVPITITALTEGAANTVYTVPASTTSILIGMRFANNGAAERAINCVMTRSAVNYRLIGDATPLPLGSALEAQQGKTVLQTGDIIKTWADVASEVDLILSLLEITP